MYLTKYQKDVLHFLQEHTDVFLDYLISKQIDQHGEDQKFYLLEDIFPLLISFIDQFLRRELGLYTWMTPGYERVIDMIIEIHNTPRQSFFAVSLINQINTVFKN